MKRKNNEPWYHPSASPGSLYSSEPPINGSFYKILSLPTRAMYLVINLTIVNMFVGGFSHFSLFVTLLYLRDILQFPHSGTDINNWLSLRLVSSDLSYKHCSISLDQMHATIRPYTALRHRLIQKWVYGVTIPALVWILPAIFIILILKNRMFN